MTATPCLVHTPDELHGSARPHSPVEGLKSLQRLSLADAQLSDPTPLRDLEHPLLLELSWGPGHRDGLLVGLAAGFDVSEWCVAVQ